MGRKSLSLAEVRRAQGDEAAARDLLERALRINEALLGADHPAVVAIRSELD